MVSQKEQASHVAVVCHQLQVKVNLLKLRMVKK